MDDDLGAVLRHYESGREELRLSAGLGELELVRTQEVLRRHLPPPPATILDIGGGTGVHAAWLLAAGYTVRLLDLSPRHVARALADLGADGLTADVADARRLPADDDSVDAALLLGPLYHLVGPADRLATLAEARRVGRPGAVVAVAAISRFASLFDGLARGFLFDPDFRTIVRQDLADGRHVNPRDDPRWFTTAFFHRPEELRDELDAAGLAIVELVGVEGLAGWLGHLADRWTDEHARTVILEAARVIESEPTLLGLSAHLLAVGRVVP
jgi:SAM-dependent methyltransferase